MNPDQPEQKPNQTAANATPPSGKPNASKPRRTRNCTTYGDISGYFGKGEMSQDTFERVFHELVTGIVEEAPEHLSMLDLDYIVQRHVGAYQTGGEGSSRSGQVTNRDVLDYLASWDWDFELEETDLDLEVDD